MTLIGCGLQGAMHLSALQAVLPLERVFAYDVDANRATEFAATADLRRSCKIEAVTDFIAATRQSDVIVTCTTAKSPFLLPDHVRAGTFIAAVGADNGEKQELDPRLLAANRTIPDLLEQAANIGELHHAILAGLMSRESIQHDLGSIVAGKATARASQEEIIIFDSTGMALQDVASAIAVYDKAKTLALPQIALND